MAENVLQSVLIRKAFVALQNKQDMPQALPWLGRTVSVPATDDEIILKYNIRVQVADLIADDAKANVYRYNRAKMETYAIPNLKVGTSLTQSEINQMYALSQNPGVPSELTWPGFINRHNAANLLGVRQRMETLIMGMMLNDFDYNRFGIVIENADWGMPSDLAVTPGTPWTTAASATPVADVQTVRRVAQERYGVDYNRMSMSLGAFLLMIATTEFQNKARLYLAPNVSFSNLTTQNTQEMVNLAQSVMGLKTIEFNDARFWSQDDAGTMTNARYQPLNKVLLTNDGDDNNASVRDWANTFVTESIVSATAGDGVFSGPEYGPTAFVTSASLDHNPPGFTQWGVARGWPRKFAETQSAVLTVGTVSDPITTTDPWV